VAEEMGSLESDLFAMVKQILWKWSMEGSTTVLTLFFGPAKIHMVLRRRVFRRHWSIEVKRHGDWHTRIVNPPHGEMATETRKRYMRRCYGEAVLRIYAGVD